MDSIKAQASLERIMIFVAVFVVAIVVVTILYGVFSSQTISFPAGVLAIKISNLSSTYIGFSTIFDSKITNPKSLVFFINSLNNSINASSMNITTQITSSGAYEYSFSGNITPSQYGILLNKTSTFVYVSQKDSSGKILYSPINYPVYTALVFSPTGNGVVFDIFPNTKDYGIQLQGYNNLITNGQELYLKNGNYNISVIEENKSSGYFFYQWATSAFFGSLSISPINSKTGILHVNNTQGIATLNLASYLAINFTSNINNIINEQRNYTCGKTDSRFCIENSTRNLFYIFKENNSAISFEYPAGISTGSGSRYGFIRYNGCDLPTSNNISENGPINCQIVNADYESEFSLHINSSNATRGCVEVTTISSGTSSCQSNINTWAITGSPVKITAIPKVDYEFNMWNGTYNTSSNPYTFTMSKESNDTASFGFSPPKITWTSPDQGNAVFNYNITQHLPNGGTITCVQNSSYCGTDRYTPFTFIFTNFTNRYSINWNWTEIGSWTFSSQNITNPNNCVNNITTSKSQYNITFINQCENIIVNGIYIPPPPAPVGLAIAVNGNGISSAYSSNNNIFKVYYLKNGTIENSITLNSNQLPYNYESSEIKGEYVNFSTVVNTTLSGGGPTIVGGLESIIGVGTCGFDGLSCPSGSYTNNITICNGNSTNCPNAGHTVYGTYYTANYRSTSSGSGGNGTSGAPLPPYKIIIQNINSNKTTEINESYNVITRPLVGTSQYINSFHPSNASTNASQIIDFVSSFNDSSIPSYHYEFNNASVEYTYKVPNVPIGSGYHNIILWGNVSGSANNEFSLSVKNTTIKNVTIKAYYNQTTSNLIKIYNYPSQDSNTEFIVDPNRPSDFIVKGLTPSGITCYNGFTHLVSGAECLISITPSAGTNFLPNATITEKDGGSTVQEEPYNIYENGISSGFCISNPNNSECNLTISQISTSYTIGVIYQPKITITPMFFGSNIFGNGSNSLQSEVLSALTQSSQINLVQDNSILFGYAIPPSNSTIGFTSPNQGYKISEGSSLYVNSSNINSCLSGSSANSFGGTWNKCLSVGNLVASGNYKISSSFSTSSIQPNFGSSFVNYADSENGCGVGGSFETCTISSSTELRNLTNTSIYCPSSYSSCNYLVNYGFNSTIKVTTAGSYYYSNIYNFTGPTNITANYGFGIPVFVIFPTLGLGTYYGISGVYCEYTSFNGANAGLCPGGYESPGILQGLSKLTHPFSDNWYKSFLNIYITTTNSYSNNIGQTYTSTTYGTGQYGNLTCNLVFTTATNSYKVIIFPNPSGNKDLTEATNNYSTISSGGSYIDYASSISLYNSPLMDEFVVSQNATTSLISTTQGCPS